MDKKTMKKELQLIRGLINSVTGLDDEDEELLQYLHGAVGKIIESLEEQTARKPMTDEQELELFKKWFLALYGKEADIHLDLNALGRWNAWKYRAAMGIKE